MVFPARYLRSQNIERPGGLVGVWVALEDVDEENGPLFYVPGSHKRPEKILTTRGKTRGERIRMPQGAQSPTSFQNAVLLEAEEESRRVGGLRPRNFLAHAGDVGIWHEHLLHGGRRILDKHRTRMSLVIHYSYDA